MYGCWWFSSRSSFSEEASQSICSQGLCVRKFTTHCSNVFGHPTIEVVGAWRGSIKICKSIYKKVIPSSLQCWVEIPRLSISSGLPWRGIQSSPQDLSWGKRTCPKWFQLESMEMGCATSRLEQQVERSWMSSLGPLSSLKGPQRPPASSSLCWWRLRLRSIGWLRAGRGHGRSFASHWKP